MLSTIRVFALFYCFCAVFCVQLSTNCGKSKANDVDEDWRIVGGKNAVEGEFPWQIILTRRFIDEFGQSMMELCGGSIINDQWVLTAAHCVSDSSEASEYSVELGVVNTQTMSGHEVKSAVDMVIHHPSFSRATVHNDVALVKLSRAIDFNQHTNLEPICLATTSTTYDKPGCVASGFGYKNAQGLQTHILQKVTEPVVSNSKCTAVHDYYSSTQNICGGGSSAGGTGTCMGDSGGPLQCKSSDGKWYQVGITSYGIPCAKPGDPDVFTSVAAYLSWIESTIDDN